MLAYSKFSALQGACESRAKASPPSQTQSPLPPCPWAPLTLSHCEAHHDQHTYKYMGLHDGILGRRAVPEGYPEIPPSCEHAPYRVILIVLSRSCCRQSYIPWLEEEFINLAGGTACPHTQGQVPGRGNSGLHKNNTWAFIQLSVFLMS